MIPISSLDIAQSSPLYSAVSLFLGHPDHTSRCYIQAHRAFLLFILLLAYSALICQNGSAILDGSLGLSAEQLIDASQEDYVMDIGIPASPQESRDIWEEEGGVNFTSRETPGRSADTPLAARSSVQVDGGQQDEKDSSSRSNLAEAQSSALKDVNISNTPNTPNTSLTMNQSGSQAPVIAGNWTIRLMGSKNSIMGLAVYQRDAVVFGSGSLNDGGDSLSVQASGLIMGPNISLDVITSRDIRLYKLDLWEKSPPSPESLSGSFQAFSAGGEYWAGTAEAEKRVK
ncbi:MAG TPA: hypothetical protein PKK68_06965 [Methanothrix soehngenii]|nr:hypothetical protein [Methanothrix soehngenii]